MSNYASAMMVVVTRQSIIYLFKSLLVLETVGMVGMSYLFGFFSLYTMGVVILLGVTATKLLDYITHTKEAWKSAMRTVDAIVPEDKV